jgi:methylmalonyl-CoA/ethylmalonyl-CoA epimerase
MEFHHAGIATADADGIVELYRELLDVPVAHEETFDDLRVTFLELANGYFELLEPTPKAEGAIPDYLERSGPGIHHLAVETDDVEAALATASEAGVRLIDEEPRPGAWGHDVAFLHPDTTGGVLVEFVEG